MPRGQRSLRGGLAPAQDYNRFRCPAGAAPLKSKAYLSVGRPQEFGRSVPQAVMGGHKGVSATPCGLHVLPPDGRTMTRLGRGSPTTTGLWSDVLPAQLFVRYRTVALPRRLATCQPRGAKAGFWETPYSFSCPYSVSRIGNRRVTNRPTTGCIAEIRGTSRSLYDFSHDGETQTAALFLGSHDPVKSLENVLAFHRMDSGTIVLDGKQCPTVEAGHRYLDLAAHGSIADCVVDEVYKHLSQHRAVTCDPNRTGFLQSDINAAAKRFLGLGSENVFGRFCEVNDVAAQPPATRLRARQGQELACEPGYLCPLKATGIGAVGARRKGPKLNKSRQPA